MTVFSVHISLAHLVIVDIEFAKTYPMIFMQQASLYHMQIVRCYYNKRKIVNVQGE